MDTISLFFLSSSDSESEFKESVVRRQLRDRSNPLELPNRAFIKRYRLNKEAFKLVLNKLNSNSQLSTGVPLVVQLISTLSLLASGGYKHSVGCDYLIGMAQSTVSKITSKLFNELDKLCANYIKFTLANSNRTKEWFMEKYKIPGVIGCIDGTHIQLQRPCQNEHMFFNRKGYHSLNAMIICDHEYRINAVNAQYGGAAHDSFIWKHSTQRRFLAVRVRINGHENAWLLGDSDFNDVHSKARCIFERTIGILKGRWRILGYRKRGRYAPEKIAKIMNVCCALHNICIEFKIPFHPPGGIVESVPTELNFKEDAQLLITGESIRNTIQHTLRN